MYNVTINLLNQSLCKLVDLSGLLDFSILILVGLSHNWAQEFLSPYSPGLIKGFCLEFDNLFVHYGFTNHLAQFPGSYCTYHKLSLQDPRATTRITLPTGSGQMFREGEVQGRVIAPRASFSEHAQICLCVS